MHGIDGMPRQLAQVRAGRRDVAVGLLGQPQPDLDAELIRHDPVNLVLRADNPLAAAGEIPVGRLGPARWVFGNTEHTPDWVEFVLAFLAEAGVRPHRTLSAQTPLSAMLEQVRERDAVAAWPRSCPPPGPDLAVRPLVEPTPIYPWHLVWRRGRMTEGIRALRTAAWDTASELAWLPVQDTPASAAAPHGDAAQHPTRR